MRGHRRLGLVGLTLAALAGPAVHGQDAAIGQWRAYGGDRANTKYSPLDQIHAGNVAALTIAWRWESVDNELDRRQPELRLGQSWFETTPLMIDGVLYVRTSYSQVAAVDAAAGRTLWVYDPESYRAGRPTQFGFVSRGLSFWTDGQQERLIFTTGDGRLIALDRRAGRPCEDFGDGGQVDLKTGYRMPITPRLMNFSSPPAICREVVVVGSSISDAPATKEMPPGFVRGYDVRSGKLLWTFNTIPQAGEFGNETWEDGSWQYTGNTNVWSIISADETLGTIYLPVSTPTNDWYGGHRLGDNLFAESLVCLEAATGRRLWHFQMVHHGLWDYDLPAAPILIDLTVEGRPVKAVAQVSKQGFCYVFDRATGRPLWPIEERAVPPSDIPGERASPTQPFPTRPPAFERQGVTEDDLIDLTPGLRAEAQAIVASRRLGPLFTPPSLQGTTNLPGWAGGANWGGAAVDPETGILYVPSITRPILGTLAKADPNRTNFAYTRTGSIYIEGPQGLPLIKPPWSRVTAMDLTRGEIAWIQPLGDGPRRHPALAGLELPRLGSGSRGLPLLTRTLLFVGSDWTSEQATGVEDRFLHAFDKATGELLWEMPMPLYVNGAPMTYLLNGKQYLAVAAGGGPREPSEIIALALP